jgi:nitric oxide reductase subunit B
MTLAHGHAAMFGTFGLLAIGLMYFGLRGVVSADWWSDRLPKLALHAFNVAIVLWLVLNIIPVGVGQYIVGATDGYWQSRSLGFYDGWTFVQWLRLLGDAAFLVGGVVLAIDVIHKLRHRRQATVADGQALPIEAATRPVTTSR